MLYFQYDEARDEYAKTLRLEVARRPLESALTAPDAIVIRRRDGSIGLNDVYRWGGCGQTAVDLKVESVVGRNWNGWVVEQVFPMPKRPLRSEACQKFTPEYKCVDMTFGNDKMSVQLASHCFLRKRVHNLDKELSYDVFMDTIKTIEFHEGSVSVPRSN
ncbi:hypothetical protein AAW51_1602 [Caldimonas brevitalea]|uniref:Uncharacterized protein n=2 Tax=Caldimonas brevitalea TaxID=413882 RepID=A0A0G3BK07_9BURK|nr:hypothetical protein AAW51_1602 [Caldimonas brevitalea]